MMLCRASQPPRPPVDSLPLGDDYVSGAVCLRERRLPKRCHAVRRYEQLVQLENVPRGVSAELMELLPIFAFKQAR